VDFTNPQAYDWYAGLLRSIFEMGIKNIKTDFGERIPTNVIYHNGQNPVLMHNFYPYLYNKCVYDAQVEFFGLNETCLFARSATVGGQKYPVHWGGDCFASYPAMAETLRAGLSLCSSGFGFFSHDIGGFEAKATPDLYKRWCAFGLLSTHSRLHGSESYRVPWLFDEESCDVLRFYTKLKGRLMPYLYAQAVKTHETGIPMMRPMIVEFMDDPACKYLDTQYMLGDSLLIVPVMNEEGIAEFYLPDGVWTDIVSELSYQGGKYHTLKCGYMEMPILARDGSIIGFGNFNNTFDYDYVDGIEFILYAPVINTASKTEVYDRNGALTLSLEATFDGDSIKVKTNPDNADFTIRLSGNNNNAIS
jgi:alpha-D-xyloside xylohydrolase